MGWSVSGFVHPDRILKNCGAVAGDVLILTKPLGTGIVNTAVKAELASKEAEAEVIGVMTSLNKKAKQIFGRYEIHACTDVTGFGLAGHSWNWQREAALPWKLTEPDCLCRRLPVSMPKWV